MQRSRAALMIALLHVAAVGHTLWPAAARAQAAPAFCQQPKLLKVWAQHFDRGKRLVDRIWTGPHTRRNCEAIDAVREEVLTKLRTVLPRATDPHSTVQCLSHGLASGVYVGLDEVQEDCFGQCVIDGQFVGQLAATLYCELSLAFGGLALDDDILPGPPSPCGQSFEESCHMSFADVSLHYDVFTGDPQLQCLPYTRGAFEAVWLQAEHNLCLYEVQS